MAISVGRESHECKDSVQSSPRFIMIAATEYQEMSAYHVRHDHQKNIYKLPIIHSIIAWMPCVSNTARETTTTIVMHIKCIVVQNNVN